MEMEGVLAPPPLSRLSTPLRGGENHPSPCAASWHAEGTQQDCLARLSQSDEQAFGEGGR
eukprot:scaffold10283_cov31-Tisochrysis_lutea.AAC.7